MKENDYTIENLVETFADHHGKAMKERKELNRKIESGEIEFQEWMREPFSIALALHHICKEIKEIKEFQRMNSGIDFQLPHGIAMKHAEDFDKTLDGAQNGG